MIAQLTQLARVDTLLGKLATARFNALLPVNIEVLQKQPDQRYRLLVGTKPVETRSEMPLEVGSKYWGVMREHPQSHAITLSGLLQKPKLLQKSGMVSFLPDFTPEKLAAVLSEKSPKAQMKLMLLEHMTEAKSKQEFMTLANMITALNQDVFTMLLRYGDQKRLFQFKKRRHQSETSSQDGMIDFYAAFEHIGPVEGVVEVHGDIRRMTLYLYYSQSLAFLEQQLPALGFDGRLLPAKKRIAPLYEPVSSLLDIKG